MLMKALCYLLLIVLLCCCQYKKNARFKLSNNTSYAWGNLFNGGKITITDLSNTGLKFRLQVYDRSYTDSFSFPILRAEYLGPEEVATKRPSNPNDPQFAIHILSDSSISIEQLQGDYLLPWINNEHAFIKNHALIDDISSINLFNDRMNYKIKRKTNGKIKYLAKCLQDYKIKKAIINGIDFTCYSGAAPVGKDTFAAMILIRDSFFTGAIVGGKDAKGFSNDPYLGRPGEIDQIFSTWFHEKTNSNIDYYYYNANVDSL